MRKTLVLNLLTFWLTHSTLFAQTGSEKQKDFSRIPTADLIKKVRENHSEFAAIEELCYRGRDIIPILPIAYAQFEKVTEFSAEWPSDILNYHLAQATSEVPEISERIGQYLLSKNDLLVLRALTFFFIAQSNISNPPKELSLILKHPNTKIRLRAAHTLILMNPSQAHLGIEVLLRSHASPNIDEKIAASNLLITLLGVSFANEIIKLLNDPNDKIMISTLEVLSQTKRLDHNYMAVALIKTLNRQLSKFSVERCRAIHNQIDLRGFFGYLYKYRPLDKYAELSSLGQENANQCAAYLFQDGAIDCQSLKRELFRWHAKENPNVRKVMNTQKCS